MDFCLAGYMYLCVGLYFIYFLILFIFDPDFTCSLIAIFILSPFLFSFYALSLSDLLYFLFYSPLHSSSSLVALYSHLILLLPHLYFILCVYFIYPSLIFNFSFIFIFTWLPMIISMYILIKGLCNNRKLRGYYSATQNYFLFQGSATSP